MQGTWALVRGVPKAAVDFLLPPRCAACGDRIRDHGHLCGACWSHLSPIAPPFCEGCGLPFEHAEAADEGPLYCGACMADPPAFDWARAAVLYDDLAKRLVLTLKHGGEGAAVPVLARMMASALGGRRDFDVILPVPLHGARLFLRRFNQSVLLADAVGRQLGLPVDRFSLIRRKATPSQGPLGRKARASNVAGAFAVTEKGKAALKGRSVLLIDDVLTTGATTSACARTLKRAGVASVGVLAFARVSNPVG